MKKLIFTLLMAFITKAMFGQASVLNGVTIGFGAGYSHTFDRLYDYTLTPDAQHNLKIQPLSKNAFVISSVLMVKLGKIAADPTRDNLLHQSNLSTYNNQVNLLESAKVHPDSAAAQSQITKLSNVSFFNRVSINLSLDLVNIGPDVGFNKSINGGIGFGYFLTDNLQAALFYDVSKANQLRDYIAKNYEDKPIPNAAGTNYNAIDTKDNNLFYSKTVSGLSLKLIFSIANKKSTPSTKAN